ncbi:MAG: hypothetical protein IH899_15655 [Planctomycetes bacterium]|nr:hypothetical protein [Planctomycetota bacterium]
MRMEEKIEPEVETAHRPYVPPDTADPQFTVNRLLARGIASSLVWMMGFGSLYSIFCAFQAKKMINRSNGELHGLKRVRWCYVVGGIGIIIWMPVVAAIFYDALWR